MPLLLAFTALFCLSDCTQAVSLEGGGVPYTTLKWTKGWPVRYADDTLDVETDLYFDRIVLLVLNIPNFRGKRLEKSVIVTGVLIDSNRILTSYNPFREFIYDPNIASNILALVLVGRSKTADYNVEYFGNAYNITCGRQIVYLPDHQIASTQWHGVDLKHSPLHDLMVLRIDGNITFSSKKIEDHTMKKFPDGQASRQLPGAFKTVLAMPNETIGENIKFCSLGYKRIRQMQIYDKLRVTSFQKGERVLENCDGWIPREWGYFICIRNKEDFAGVGSGAMLVSNNKLYGVGSFAYFKGAAGILAFTDVREYYDQIMNTCTLRETASKPR